MKLTRLSGLLAAALTVSSPAFAAGYFQNWPVVGGPSYCALYAGDGVTCVESVPAGPSALTGNERVPMDTHLPNGNQPQTVLASPAVLNAGPTQYITPLTGTSVAVSANTRQVIIEPAGTIAALTLTLPAATALADNQRIGICSTQVVTALTITPGTGSTVSNTVTALAIPGATGAGSCYEWVYVASQTKWYRAQ